MHSEWLAVEHYRIHVMELWPDGPRKTAGLAAARSALDRLVKTIPWESSFVCSTCASRRRNVTAISCGPAVHSAPYELAA